MSHGSGRDAWGLGDKASSPSHPLVSMLCLVLIFLGVLIMVFGPDLFD